MLKRFLFSCVVIFSVNLNAQVVMVDIAVNQHQYTNYQALLSGKSCDQVTSYQHPNAYRLSLELLLICKALHLANSNFQFNYLVVPNYARALKSAENGDFIMPATSIWQPDANTKHLYVTTAIFKQSQFVKGFFATPAVKEKIDKQISMQNIQPDKALAILKQYTVLSSQQWLYDWDMLKALGFTTANASHEASLCKMLEAGRAQLYVGELVMQGTEKTLFPCQQLNLKSINHIKLNFPLSRHFVVAKNHPHAAEFFKQLQRGISLLSSSGEIDKMLYPLISIKEKVATSTDLSPLN